MIVAEEQVWFDQARPTLVNWPGPDQREHLRAALPLREPLASQEPP